MRLTGPLSKIAEGQFNLSSGTIDLIAVKFVGNISVPIVKNLIQLADPLSNMAEIKITGNFQQPKWSCYFQATDRYENFTETIHTCEYSILHDPKIKFSLSNYFKSTGG